MRTNIWIKSYALLIVTGISAISASSVDLPKIETTSSKNIYILEPRMEHKGEGLSLSGNLTSRPGDGLPSNPYLHIKTYNFEGKLISSSVVKINTATLELNRKMPLHFDSYRVNIPTSATKITIKTQCPDF